VTEWRK